MNRGRLAYVVPLAVAAAALAAAVATGAPARRAKTARPAVADSNIVLVRIGKEAITRGDVQRRIESLPEQFRANYSTPEGRQQLLDRMIEERVWLTQATKQGVADRPPVRQQLEQQRRDLLIRTYLNEVMSAMPAVSDSEAKVYYDEHADEYRVPASISVRHIQTKTEPDAKRLKAWARSQDWLKLAQRYSTDTLTRASGGNLGTISREGAFGTLGMQPALAESAFALAEGQVGGPYRTDRGWHLLRVDAVKPETVRPFDQVKPMIARQLGSQRQQEYYRERLEEARRTLGVAPDSGAIRGFVSQRKSAREMFNEAQTLGSAEQRIDAYRKLLAEYPDSDVSPQAQFMVGFIYSEELKNYEEAEKAFRALLGRWPQAELASSARWMIENMRSEDAPAFIELDADTSAAGSDSAGPPGKRPPGGPGRTVPPDRADRP
jgi:peptidyl-prolyl cis-trans isomerase C